MRLSDLLGCVVDDANGERAGVVTDVRVVQSGPIVGTFGNAFAIEGLIVGPRQWLSRLGFNRGEIKAPALVRFVAGMAQRGQVFVPWELVVRREEGKVWISAAKSELRAPELLRSSIDPPSPQAVEPKPGE